MQFFTPRPARPAEPSSKERLRDAALRCFAVSGIAATSLRTVAEAAGASTGLVQHYFGTKAALVAAVDDYVIRVITDALEAEPLPPAPLDALAEMGRRLIGVMADHEGVVDYIGRALVEGDSIGSEIFDALLRISQTQQSLLLDRDQARPDQDLIWGALNPLMLRLGPVILRTHIERHLPEPFGTPNQLTRWDDAVTAVIRHGQMQPKSDS